MARTGCASAAVTSACGTARNRRRARQVLPAYGLQSLPPIPSQEFTKVLLRTTHGGHFNMAEKRTFLLCVDTRGEIGNLLRELLDFGDVFTHEADKHGLRGRLAVDPILDVVAFGILFAHFALGLANGGDHHIAVHADNGAAVLDGLLHLRRERVHPLHGGGPLLREVEDRSKKLLQIVGAQVRHRLVELQKYGAASAGLDSWGTRVRARGSCAAGRKGASYHADLEMLAPAMLPAAAAVDIHDDGMTPKFKLGDLDGVARMDRGPMRRNGTVEQLLVQRLARIHQEAFFTGG